MTPGADSFLDRTAFFHRYQSLGNTLFRPVQLSPLLNPSLLLVNDTAAADCFGVQALTEADLKRLLAIGSGQTLTSTMSPIAQKYCGHQFGVFNPSLGDGRGLLLGEFLTPAGNWCDLHLKGAGPTPFSRGGDGRAVVRSSIREYLISEYLHQLGVPSTRSLAVITSDTPVQRETEERAATLLRLASTHLRFGHVEYLFHSDQQATLQRLLEHVIDTHYPALASRDNPYAALFDDIMARTAIMIAHWQAQGFCHGVMNTDNFSLVGETFDFGPYSMMDRYDPAFICNHTDWQGRYAFQQQPKIGLWNLNALASGFSDLVDKAALTESLKRYSDVFHDALFTLFSHKLGIDRHHTAAERLVEGLLQQMAQQGLDFPLTFIQLTDDTSCRLDNRLPPPPPPLGEWLAEWQQAQHALGLEQALQRMTAHNPRYPLRNGVIQQAITDHANGDEHLLQQLNRMVQAPCRHDPALEFLREPPAPHHCNLTLSCSS